MSSIWLENLQCWHLFICLDVLQTDLLSCRDIHWDLFNCKKEPWVQSSPSWDTSLTRDHSSLPMMKCSIESLHPLMTCYSHGKYSEIRYVRSSMRFWSMSCFLTANAPENEMCPSAKKQFNSPESGVKRRAWKNRSIIPRIQEHGTVASGQPTFHCDSLDQISLSPYPPRLAWLATLQTMWIICAHGGNSVPSAGMPS